MRNSCISAPPNPASHDTMDRPITIRRALLFMAVCSPLMLGTRYFAWPHQALPFAILLVVTLLFLRWDGRSPAVLGLDLSWRRVVEFLAGLGGGALLVVVVALCAYVVLPFPWVRNAAFEPAAMASAFLYLFYSNTAEELVFRGYGFERLMAGIGHWPAQIVTALLFALFHILNGWPWQTALIGTTSGSLLFGLVFVRWQSVPAAAGVHVAGNGIRSLFLTDPPTALTFFAPLAPRPWNSSEQLLANCIHVAITILFCVVLARSVRHNRRKTGAG